jgi:hypothetical protein
MHAAIQFGFEHTEVYQEWFKKSNYLGLLSVANEYELSQLIEKAINSGIRFSIFREPDIDNQITAITFEPGLKSKKLCANLKLALKEA